MRIKRVRNYPRIPTSINFSSLAPGEESRLFDELGSSDEYPDIDKELLLLKNIEHLDSDKERCVLLFEILREYGYQLDYHSIAHALHVELRWFMRIKKNMRNKVLLITDNS